MSDKDTRMRSQILRDEWKRLQKEWPVLRGWKLRLNGRFTSTGGRCYHSRKRIEVAKWVWNRAPLDEAANTIRHEAAHALAGPGHGHGSTWKEWAVKVGAEPVRCYSQRMAALSPAREARAKSPWSARCRECSYEYQYARKPKYAGRPNAYKHNGCGGTMTILKEGEPYVS